MYSFAASGGGVLRLELETVAQVRAQAHTVTGGRSVLVGPQGDVVEELRQLRAQRQVNGVAGRGDHEIADVLHTVVVGDDDLLCEPSVTRTSADAHRVSVSMEKLSWEKARQTDACVGGCGRPPLNREKSHFCSSVRS
jgi:hypothetical protein